MPTLRIEPHERVAFVGKTGSGKTFLARYLAATIPRFVALDPKGTMGPEWNLEEWSDQAAKKLRRGDPIRVRIPAPLDGDWETFLWLCYESRDLTVYADEAYGLTPPGRRPGPALTALYTRGRELGIGTWAATQRPAWVPLFMLSEAEWLFVFRLRLLNDRKRMAEIGGEALLEPPPEGDRHGFYITNAEWDAPLYTSGLNI